MESRASRMLEGLSESEGLFNYGPTLSRVLSSTWKFLARGRPVTEEQVIAIATDARAGLSEANEFLSRVTEQDANGNIVGAMGLSLNKHAHTFIVDGTPMSTWCAMDTLFLPAMIGQVATVESISPVRSETIRLKVTPEGVESCSPPGAVVSLRVIDPEDVDMSAASAIWASFCHHIYFFASRDEGEEWAASRTDIELVTVDQAYDLAMRIWSGGDGTMGAIAPRGPR